MTSDPLKKKPKFNKQTTKPNTQLDKQDYKEDSVKNRLLPFSNTNYKMWKLSNDELLCS